MKVLTTLAAMVALVTATIGVGYWVQSVNARLTALEAVKPIDPKAEQCRDLANALPNARGKTKAGYLAALNGLGCNK